MLRIVNPMEVAVAIVTTLTSHRKRWRVAVLFAARHKAPGIQPGWPTCKSRSSSRIAAQGDRVLPDSP